MGNREEFARHFREVQSKFSQLYTTLLSNLGITLPQYALLSQLVFFGTLPMTEISKRLRISKPAVTSLVDRLELNQCLKRIPHPKDRRIYLLEIQPRGEKIVRHVQSKVLSILLQAFSKFNRHEKMTLNRFYALLAQILGIICSESRHKTKRTSAQ